MPGNETTIGTKFAVKSTIKGGLEAPTIVPVAKGYVLIVSTTTGWSPNAGRQYFAPSLSGPWKLLGPVTPDSKTSFGSQGTFALSVGCHWLYLGDRWSFPNLKDASYVWLPIRNVAVAGENTPLKIDGSVRAGWKNCVDEL